MSDPQTVDPEVSRAKFAREIANFRQLADLYRKRGIFLIEAEFPKVSLMFAATKVKVATPIVAVVVVDFTDYDLQPPSVTFVDPFSGEPLKFKDLRMHLLRAPTIPGASPETVQSMIQQGLAAPEALTQANSQDDPPFICLPGIREYHDNPAHSGDPWLLHRTSGAGSLGFIADKICSYGASQITELQVQLQPVVAGFAYRFQAA